MSEWKKVGDVDPDQVIVPTAEGLIDMCATTNALGFVAFTINRRGQMTPELQARIEAKMKELEDERRGQPF